MTFGCSSLLASHRFFSGAPTRRAQRAAVSPKSGARPQRAPRPQGETRAAHAAGALAPPMHVFENANLWARCTHKSEFSEKHRRAGSGKIHRLSGGDKRRHRLARIRSSQPDQHLRNCVASEASRRAEFDGEIGWSGIQPGSSSTSGMPLGSCSRTDRSGPAALVASLSRSARAHQGFARCARRLRRP